MSQPGRPSPVQPPFDGQGPNSIAPAQRPYARSVPSFIGRPDHRTLGPRLPPIHSLSPVQSAPDHGRTSVHLPPVHVPPTGTDESEKPARVRSIPVAHLLSADPPLPSRSVESGPSQQQAAHGRSPSDTCLISPAQYHRSPPVLFPSRSQQQPPPPPPVPKYQIEQYHRAQYPTNPSIRPPEKQQQPPPPRFSPTLSNYSSPTYAHSELSRRSSVGGPQSRPGVAPKPRVSIPPPLNYILSIRQQPAAARACGFGERDRRVIDPPPILELKITDRVNDSPAQDPNAMLALHCTLLSPDGHDDETELPSAHPDMPSTRRLMGTLVASPYQAKDENGVAGTFFVFPDLSCRSPGAYRLRFKLLRVDPTNMTPGAIHGSVASIVTDVFNVYTAKDFPGMRASSALLKSLRRQGLNVGVKKGSEARKGKGRSKDEASQASSSEGGENTDGGGESSSATSPKANKSSKRKTKRRRQVE